METTQQIPRKQQLPMNVMAAASFWMGWIAILIMFIPVMNFFNFVIGLIGLVFGFIGVRQIKRAQGSMMGMSRAVTGIVTNLIGLGVTLWVLVKVIEKGLGG